MKPLTPLQLAVLRALADSYPMTNRKIAGALGKSESSVHSPIRALHDRAFIETAGGCWNPRTSWRITDAGLDYLAEVDA